MKGNVRIYTVDVGTGEEELVREEKNLVVNAGLDFTAEGAFYIHTNLPSMKYIAIGTSTTAPAAGQTTLVSEIQREEDGAKGTGGTPGTFYHHSPMFTFDSSTDVTEAGMFNESTGGVMFARVTFTAITCSPTKGLKIEWDVVLANA